MSRIISGRSMVLVLVVVAAAAGCRPAEKAHESAVASRGFTRYQLVARASSPAAAEFTTVTSMDVDGPGNVYVGDAENVVVLGPDARPLRKVGRHGNGPGEFQYVNNVRLLPGDSLFAFDAGAERVTVFPPNSDHPAYSVNLSTAGLVFPFWVAPSSDGGMLAMFRAAYGVGPDGKERGPSVELLRVLNPDASIRRDSVLKFPEYEAVNINKGEMQGTLFSPFGRRMLFADVGDRVYSAWSGNWKIDVYSTAGAHLRTIEPGEPPRPRPVTQAEMDSVVESMASHIPFPRPVLQRAMEDAGRSTWPLLRQLLVDDAGRIWLAVAGQRGESDHWVAVDEQGRRVGAFDLPASVKLHVIRGDSAYGVALDADEVPHVVIYDLKPVHPEPKRS